MRASLAIARMAFAAVASAAAMNAAAQDYPSRPITIVVPFPAGGPTDVLARIVARPMTDVLRQQVIVENVGGAAGTVGAARVARAAPDGYTFLFHNISHATAPSLYRSLPYDPILDFEPIGLIAEVPQALVGRKNLVAGSMPEFSRHLKTHGTKVNIATAGRGSGSHLCALLLMSALDIKLTTVAYRGTAPAVTDLVSGQVDVMCDQVSNTGSQIRAGSIESYCVAAIGPVATLPEVRPCGQVGLPGFSASVWHGLYAPKGTPPAVLKSVGEALRLALREPAVIARFADLGTEPERPDRVMPEALRDHLRAEIAKWSAVIRAANLPAE